MRTRIGSAAVVGVIIAMFLIELARNAVGNDARLLDLGALPDSGQIHHEYWRLITAGFLHYDLTHLVLNTLLLLLIGPGICGPDTHAKFTGTAEVNGSPQTLKVEVDDCGEPGTADTFSIQTDTYGASGVLISGNIQIHKGDFSAAAADTDGDSFGRTRNGSPLFGDDREFELGTNLGQACAATATKNDESPDPNPLDTNDDGFTDISDVVSVLEPFGELQAPSNVRYDLNLDGFIDIGDITLMTDRFGKQCVSSGPLG